MQKIKNIFKKIKENKKNIISAIIVFVIVIIVFSLFSSNQLEKTSNQSYEYVADIVENAMYESDSMVMGKVSGSSGPVASAVTKGINLQQDSEYLQNRKVIKNSNLNLTVKNLNQSRTNIENIVKKYNGYISNIRANNYSYEKRLNITAKVPNKDFYNVNTEVKSQNGVEKVNSESISLSDVTKQYNDLKLRIKNKKSEEEQYRKIMEKAVKIEDVLKVTSSLNKVRNEIESLEIQFKNLNQQVSFSTLQIELVSVVDKVIEGEAWSPTTEVKIAFENLKNNLKSLYSEILNFVAKLPVYIFYLVVLLIGFKILKILFRFVKSKL